MECKQNPEESYEFFKDIENYIKQAILAENTDVSSDAESECVSFMNSFGSHFKDIQTAKRICKQFIKLYYSLKGTTGNFNSEPKYQKCREFLNYWLNFKLRENLKNGDDTVCYIYNAIESQFTNSLEHYINLYFIYDIDKNDLYKMNILYSLYENYNKLNAIKYNNPELDKQSLLTHSSACCIDYIKASYICNPDNNNNNINGKFCEKLTAFQSKYDKLYEEAAGKGSDYSKNFIRLSECGNNKIITTAVTGSIVGLIPLFGILYKFTPMGQMFRSKKGILNNDEEMTKISSTEHDNEPLRFQQGSYNIKYESL
ncbi:PIR protein [Plasmodium vivax]|uniref:VIR protein n=1 Tax=Plasmodium vivax TaxID=5855 RepID=A0A565A782_PLAVI|nr:PIR protein [Plasmodium vivax]